MIHLIIKQIRKIVAFVRTDLINNIEQPELVEYSTQPENILGEGGCGRVYAGRFRGNNVAIKVIGTYQINFQLQPLKFNGHFRLIRHVSEIYSLVRSNKM